MPPTLPMQLLNNGHRRPSDIVGLIATVLLWQCSAIAVAPEPAITNEWVVLDGVRNFSYSMVCCLVDNGIPCTVVVRPKDLLFAGMRLPQSPLITMVEADFAAPQRPAALEDAVKGARYLFLDPEDDCFATWPETVIAITRNALSLARKYKLHVIYPARVYSFDTSGIITEQSAFNPITSQGQTVSRIENILNTASSSKQCKVTKIRVSYAFGPAVYDYLLSSTFKDMPSLGRLTWLFRTDKPHQFVYTYDVARLALQLSSRMQPDHYEQYVLFSGYTYPSVEAFGQAIAATAGTTLKQRIVGKFLLAFICLSEPNAQRGSDLTAYFDSPVFIEDSAMLTETLHFQPTPPSEAFAKTLAWFQEHPETRGVFKKD